jgi:pimeloyl-ACP methyl ester carboxylesterase
VPRTFVLVAGAWHGAWCWHRLEPLLRERGHRVLTTELEGTGADATDPRAVTLDRWAAQLVQLLEAEVQPVLVGHSRGGLVISRVAELAPASISRLVYVAAYLLPAGGTIAEAARADGASLIAPNMIPVVPGVTCGLREQILPEAFYGDCDEQTVAESCARLTPEPLRPLVTPLRITAERFGRVPRAYVECTRDRAVTLQAQRRMLSVHPCDPVLTLESDHSPFLSHPRPLAQWLGGL